MGAIAPTASARPQRIAEPFDVSVRSCAVLLMRPGGEI
jgi:hypothetical protein